MTCKCPKKWCYHRPGCRVEERHAYLKTLVTAPRAPPAQSRACAAALRAIERAIDRLHHAEREPMRGLRLVQLYARRDELTGTET